MHRVILSQENLRLLMIILVAIVFGGLAEGFIVSKLRPRHLEEDEKPDPAEKPESDEKPRPDEKPDPAEKPESDEKPDAPRPDLPQRPQEQGKVPIGRDPHLADGAFLEDLEKDSQ